MLFVEFKFAMVRYFVETYNTAVLTAVGRTYDKFFLHVEEFGIILEFHISGIHKEIAVAVELHE